MSLKNKKEEILKLVGEYIKEKHQSEQWKEGDWIQYSGPHFDNKEYVAGIGSLLDEWLIFGKKAREFELEFAKFLGKKYGTFVNSGSSAVLLMLAAAKSKNLADLKGKIITPVVCFPTTLAPIIQLGFEPVFVDVDIPSLNPNLDQVEEALKNDPDISAIMFAHVLGNPPDMDRLMRLVKKYDLVYLEDSCDAVGSTYDGKKLGSFGHLSACSFFPAHHMTCGEGGYVATNYKDTNKLITSLRDWGRACFCNSATPGNVTAGTACKHRYQKWLPGMPETNYDHRYVFSEIGFNMKPMEMQGAFGLEQIKKLPVMDQARRDNHKKLYNIFKKWEKYFHLPEATKKSDPCWFAFLLTVKHGATFTREDFIEYMEKSKIQTRAYFSGNILAHPGYFHLADELGIKDVQKEFPNATFSTKNSFFLGTYVGLTQEKIDYIEKKVDEFFKARGL